MLANNAKAAPVKARLKIHMVVGGEAHEAGDIVEMPAREFNYLANLDRVEVAPSEPAKDKDK
jgi:hypothetical protein